MLVICKAMKKRFEVKVKTYLYIEADDLKEANKIIQETYPEFETTSFYNCTDNVNHNVIGCCVISGLSIFEGDEFYSDSEGVMWFKEYGE